MRFLSLLGLGSCLLLCSTLYAQLHIQKISEPSGKTLDKALHTSELIQSDSKPFTVKLQIAQPKVEDGPYSATIEETWVSPTEWIRKVNAPGLSQLTVMNTTGTHFVTKGDYFPEWLRTFVTALFTPVPDKDVWDKLQMPLTHIELPNGGKSSPCMHNEFNLGTSPVVQINFANVCFKDGVIENVQSPNYSAGFSNYQKFGRLKVPRMISVQDGRIGLTGTIISLEPAQSTDPDLFATPADASNTDPLASFTVSTEQLTKLAGGSIPLPWPDPIPGSGMFTVWVSLDHDGVIKEVHTLNTDESGFAYDMSSKLIGRQWKAPKLNGESVQVEGAIVFSYPPIAQ